VAFPAGAVFFAAGFGVAVQATAGIVLPTFPCWPGSVNGWVGEIPSGSFHRLELAVLPPPVGLELGLEPGLAVPMLLAGLIRVPVSWLRMTTPTTTMATAAEAAKTGFSQAPADPRRPGRLACPRRPRCPRPAGVRAG